MIYLDDAAIIGAERGAAPDNPYRSGYGRRIPTGLRIKLDNGRWYRVYVAQYGNIGTAYIRTKHAGERYLDAACEARIEDLLD